jgi:hypothetical protein
MTRQALQHLTADELDLLLEGSFPEGVRQHLGTCPPCSQLLQEARRVVHALSSVPLHVPRAGFEDRVMALVRIAVPASVLATLRTWALASQRNMAVAAMLAVALLASLGGSIAWSFANTELLASLGRTVLGAVAESGWVVARSLASTLFEQPWYASVRAALDSPTRLAFAAGGLVTTWVAGLLLLRRLVAIPAQRVAHETF